MVYEIIKAIEDRVGGAYSPSPGVIYPTLTLLEELGYVTVEGRGRRWQEAARDHGRGGVAFSTQTVARSTRCSHAWTRRAKPTATGPAPQILRAMENLKLALRMRISRPLTAAQVSTVAAALDAAATSVEQS